MPSGLTRGWDPVRRQGHAPPQESTAQQDQGINHAYDVIAPVIVFLVDVVFSMRTAARSDGLNLTG
jgi:hypothetical protein